jgi:hypothetical protein
LVTEVIREIKRGRKIVKLKVVVEVTKNTEIKLESNGCNLVKVKRFIKFKGSFAITLGIKANIIKRISARNIS